MCVHAHSVFSDRDANTDISAGGSSLQLVSPRWGRCLAASWGFGGGEVWAEFGGTLPLPPRGSAWPFQSLVPTSREAPAVRLEGGSERPRGEPALTPPHLCLPPTRPIGHGPRWEVWAGRCLDSPSPLHGEAGGACLPCAHPAPQQSPHTSWPHGLPSPPSHLPHVRSARGACGQLGEPAVS